MRQVLERRLGGGELDEDAVPDEQRPGIDRDRDAEPPGPRDLAGIAAHRRVAGLLERGDHAEVGRSSPPA